MILELNDINTFYGTSHILFDVSLTVNEKEVVCLLGRNGVGKTTILRSIMGINPPAAGSIKFKGIEIRGWQPYRIAKLGIGYVPEDRRIFPDLTVHENLIVAAKESTRSKNNWNLEKVYTLFPQLKDLHRRRGELLSGGEQQMLAISRTLMTNPDLLLLDEPMEGLAPLAARGLEEQILKLKNMGMPILLCEHIKFSLGLSERAYVLDKGEVCFEGTISELSQNEQIKREHLMV